MISKTQPKPAPPYLGQLLSLSFVAAVSASVSGSIPPFGSSTEPEVYRVSYQRYASADGRIAIGERFGLSAQAVCKRFKRIMELYLEGKKQRENEKAKNAKTPVGAGVHSESRWCI